MTAAEITTTDSADCSCLYSIDTVHLQVQGETGYHHVKSLYHLFSVIGITWLVTQSFHYGLSRRNVQMENYSVECIEKRGEKKQKTKKRGPWMITTCKRINKKSCEDCEVIKIKWAFCNVYEVKSNRLDRILECERTDNSCAQKHFKCLITYLSMLLSLNIVYEYTKMEFYWMMISTISNIFYSHVYCILWYLFFKINLSLLILILNSIKLQERNVYPKGTF